MIIRNRQSESNERKKAPGDALPYLEERLKIVGAGVSGLGSAAGDDQELAQRIMDAEVEQL